MDFCIITHVYNEPENILKRYFTTLRQFHPDVDVTIISDGKDNKLVEELCKKYNCNYVLGERLKNVENGKDWILRFLKIFKSKKCDLMIQLDPDSMIHNKFTFPKDLEYFGDLVTDTKTNEKYIAGFCVGITKKCCNKILKSKLLETKDFSNNSYTKPYGEVFRYETSLYNIIKELKIKSGQWQRVTSTVLVNQNLTPYLICSHKPA